MLAFAGLALLAQIPGDATVELVWGPEPGSVLEREIEFELRGGLDGVSLGAVTMLRVDWLSEVSIIGELKLRDEVLELGRGRPLRLRREFERVSTDWNGPTRRDVLPELDGRPIRLEWNEDESTWKAEWEHPRSRSTPAPALPADLDLLGFLPEGPVEVGACWRVPARAVESLLAPGGGLHVDEGLGSAWGLDGFANAFDFERLRRIREGEVQCRLERIERVDGRRMAAIEFGWTWWGTLDDVLEPSPELPWARYAREGTSLDVDARAWGRLRWDLEGRCARELELHAELDGNLRASSRAYTWGTRVALRGTWFVAITSR